MAEILMEILGDKLCLPSEMAVGWLMDPDEVSMTPPYYPTHSRTCSLAHRHTHTY